MYALSLIHICGNAAAVSLNAGTYYYKELTAPAGYALDSSVQSFTVTAGQNTALSVSAVSYTHLYGF